MTIIKSLTTAAFAGAALLGVASAATVDVSTTADVVTVGDTFEVRLNFSADDSAEFLFDAIAEFEFDGALFDFVSADFTDPATGLNQLSLPDDPDAIGEGIFEVAQLSDNLLDITAVSDNSFAFLQDEQADDFTLVTLTFSAEEVGTGDLGLGAFFDFLFANDPDFANADFFSADVLDAFVTVEVAPIPLPGAAVFLLTGAAGLFARRRVAA